MWATSLPGYRAAALRAAAALVAVPLALGGCSSGDGSDEDASDRDASDSEAAPTEPLRPRLASPAEATTIVTADGPPALVVATSEALFDEAPVVVLAQDGDLSAQAPAASAAVALGVPLLLTPEGADVASPDPETSATTTTEPAASTTTEAAAGAPVADELRRLSPRVVLAVGSPAARWIDDQDLDVSVVAVPADPDALDALAPLDLGEPRAVEHDALAAEAAGLARPAPDLLTLAGAEPSGEDAGDGEPGSDDDELPEVEEAEAQESLLVVVERDVDVASVATARATGAQVVTVAGGDPRADRAAIAALAEGDLPEQVVALGDGFGAAEQLRQRLEVAATGVELPGGGQVLFPGRRMIALYGHPGAPVLGVLGEQPVDAAVTRAQQLAAGYEGLVSEPVVPAFEIITTVASASAGPDGNYSSESEVADLRPWVDAAGAAGVYVVLDLQPGRTDFLTQAQRYEELLAEPHVGLALDPEWRLGPDQVHMAQIGSVPVAEVNAVADWLAGLTREHGLPQKLLLLHQFQVRMLADRGQVDTDHDELAVLVHADGFGTPGQKLDTWNALRSEPLPGAWWGWKNFIDEDRPTFTPAETVAIEPTPWFVSYQ